MTDLATDLAHDGVRPAPLADDVYFDVGEHGAALAEARAAASAALDDGVGVVVDALERGADLNLTECARRLGVTKATLYARLPRDLVAGRHPDPDPQEDPTDA